MPPKKGSSKKPPKAKTPTLIDGLTKEEMTKEQLEEYIVRLREELDREREERNYFQLERDKIHTFREMTERQLEEAKADLTKLHRDSEEEERRHQVEIKVYKQKMKHLLCEHQNTISELKAKAVISSDAVQREQQHLESELQQEMKTIMANMLELDNESLVLELEQKHDEEMKETRNRWEKQLKEVKVKYVKKVELLHQELENQRNTLVAEQEDHWNHRVFSLIENHEEKISKYNALIQELPQIEEKNGLIKEAESNQLCFMEDNKKVAEALSKVEEETAAIEKKMKHFTIKKNENEMIRQKELNDLKNDHKDLEQKFSKLQLERDELYRTFNQNIQGVAQKASLRGEQLERQLSELTERLETTQVQLDSVLSASNMDQTALQDVMNHIEDNINYSNNSIKDLKQKKAQISMAQKNLQLYYQKKQRALGVSEQQLV